MSSAGSEATLPARRTSPKPKPHITDTPITLDNWYKHVNWLNVYFIGGIPLMGCIAAIWTPLKIQTAIWAVIYYFCTGLGTSLDPVTIP
jgi:stearoyl-CoA desaturase (Delta-9 desaturase)